MAINVTETVYTLDSWVAKKVDDTTTANITYIWLAPIWTAWSSASWRIYVVDTTTLAAEIKRPQVWWVASWDFVFTWDDRATYTYS